eukprot:4481993-Amphidinium_carterae.1
MRDPFCLSRPASSAALLFAVPGRALCVVSCPAKFLQVICPAVSPNHSVLSYSSPKQSLAEPPSQSISQASVREIGRAHCECIWPPGGRSCG